MEKGANRTRYNQQFSIDHDSSAILGTEIMNFADIYFDFNPPIRTNTVVNTLSDFQPEDIGSVQGITHTYLPSGTSSLVSSRQPQFLISPNPARDRIRISVEGYKHKDLDLVLFDIHRKKLLENRLRLAPPSSFVLALPELAPGLYFLQFNQQYTYKILIRA